MNAENNKFTPHESLALIQKVVDETRRRYEENGFIITLWGIFVVLAGVSQFILIKMGHGNISYFAWVFTMIPMFLFTFYYMYKVEQKTEKNSRVPDISGMAWLMAGCMAMLTGFVFSNKLGSAFTTTLFLPFCIASLVSAMQLRNTAFIWLSILSVIIAYGCLYVPFIYHPLMSAAIAAVLFLIPGLILRSQYNKRNRV